MIAPGDQLVERDIPWAPVRAGSCTSHGPSIGRAAGRLSTWQRSVRPEAVLSSYDPFCHASSRKSPSVRQLHLSDRRGSTTSSRRTIWPSRTADLQRDAVERVVDRKRFERLHGGVVSLAQSPRREPPFAAVDNRLDLGRHVARFGRIARRRRRRLFARRSFAATGASEHRCFGRLGSRRSPDRDRSWPGRNTTNTDSCGSSRSGTRVTPPTGSYTAMGSIRPVCGRHNSGCPAAARKTHVPCTTPSILLATK